MTSHFHSRILDTQAKQFLSEFKMLLTPKIDSHEALSHNVSDIILAVRNGGDSTLCDLTRRLDNVELDADHIQFSEAEINDEISKVSSEDRNALRMAAERISAYHLKQYPEDKMWGDSAGAVLGWRWHPIERVGLYVPGGKASYPSSVLMNAIPARVAGVKEIVITTPTPSGVLNPLVLCAARLAGVETIYRIGGAQAIAALAYGTQTIAAVDKITGPGNAYVSEAKRQVFGVTGIDMIAGPSEVVIIADKNNDPDWIAMDLLAQAEHDENARSIFLTDDSKLADSVHKSVERNIPTLSRANIAKKSWQNNSAIILCKSLDEAISLSNQLAPEHLQLSIEDPRASLTAITNAGAVFLGRWTPEAAGDYILGPNHVLPTSRAARFSSGLSVLDFMKRTTISELSPSGMGQVGPSAVRLAKSEGLKAHAKSIELRLQSLSGPDDVE